ncbi:MAG: hypothetical protein SynsKO_11660 [Synoicihabitans sp.]
MIFNFGKRAPNSAEAKHYLALTTRKPSRKAALAESPIVALDAETSGLDAANDHILSIGIVPLRGDRIEIAGRRTWLVKQSDSPNNEAVKIHGIAPGESAQGEEEADVMRELLEVLAGKIVVGHHIGFDARVLGIAMRRHFGVKFRNPLIDTGIMAMRHLDAFHKSGYANQRPPTLEELCSHARLPITGRHTASGDAFTTAQVFLWLCGRMRIRFKRELVAGDLLN